MVEARGPTDGNGPDTRAPDELARRRRLLKTVERLLGSAPDEQRALSRLARLVVPDLADWSMVDRVADGGRLRRTAVCHRDPAREPLLQELSRDLAADQPVAACVARVARTGVPQMASSIPAGLLRRMARDERELEVLRTLELTSYLCVPVARQGRVVGVLTMAHAESGRRYTPRDLELAEAVGRLAAELVEAATAGKVQPIGPPQLQRQQAFARVALQHLRDGVVGCDEAARLVLFNEAAQSFHGMPARPVPPERWPEHYDLFHPDGTTRLRPEEVPLARALAGHEVRDVEMVISPRAGDRRVVLCNGEAVFGDDGRKLGALVTMHDITERKYAEAQLTRQALYDPLTALPNRLLLLDRLRQALARTRRRPQSVAVLLLDLDRFKVVNESLGHEAGDEVLVEAASRLVSVLRPSDTVARLGGDEFVVLCEDIAGADEAVEVSQRVEATLAAPYLLRDRLDGDSTEDVEVVLQTSVGIALADGVERPEDLLRNADAAMNRAKLRGRGRHELYDDTLRLQAVGRLQTENSLRRALEQDRLRLLYQPIVDLRDGHLVAVEALLRYQNTEGGLVPPSEFLAVAEDTGLIGPIGAWAIEEACRQVREWRTAGAGDVSVAVNISARQLASPALLRTLTAGLTDSGLQPGTVSLEITETVLMEASSSTLRMMERLRATGCRLGIDDFGTGYSSLTYLRSFPVDFVKVDRSFVSGLGADAEDTAIVTAVVWLGRALGLTTIAEGVETDGQSAMLRDLGCDLAQGYHYGRPASGEHILSLLESGAARISGARRGG